MRVVEQVRVACYDVFAGLAELPVLRVVKRAVDGAAGYGAAGEEDAVGGLDGDVDAGILRCTYRTLGRLLLPPSHVRPSRSLAVVA